MSGIVILNISSGYGFAQDQIKSVIKYGSIVIIISILYSLVLPEIFRKIFNPEEWNIKKTLLVIFLSTISIVITITIVAYKFDNNNNLEFFQYFILILLRSIVLSFFPVIALVYYFEGVLRNKNRNTAKNIFNELHKENTVQKSARVKDFVFAENTKDEIQIAEDDLLYIKAEGNYCNIFYQRNSIILHKLVRSKLKVIEMKLYESGNFMRCHKSYLINLSKISDVTGNARGYLFHLVNHTNKIPGSRTLSKSLIRRIKITRNN